MLKKVKNKKKLKSFYFLINKTVKCKFDLSAPKSNELSVNFGLNGDLIINNFTMAFLLFKRWYTLFSSWRSVTNYFTQVPFYCKLLPGCKR